MQMAIMAADFKMEKGVWRGGQQSDIAAEKQFHQDRVDQVNKDVALLQVQREQEERITVALNSKNKEYDEMIQNQRESREEMALEVIYLQELGKLIDTSTDAAYNFGNSMAFAAGEMMGAGESMTSFGNKAAMMVSNLVGTIGPAFTAMGQGLLAVRDMSGIGLIAAGAAMSVAAGFIAGKFGDVASSSSASNASSAFARQVDRVIDKDKDDRESRDVHVYLGDVTRPIISQTVTDEMDRFNIRPTNGWRGRGQYRKQRWIRNRLVQAEDRR